MSQTPESLNKRAYNAINTNLDTSIFYADRALELSVKTNNKREEINSYLNIGLAHIGKRNYSKSLAYLNRADSMSQAIEDKQSEAISKMQIASSLSIFSQYSFDSTSEYSNRISNYYKLALTHFIQSNDTFNLVRLYLKRGVHSERNTMYSNAIDDYTTAYQLANLSGDSIQIAQASQNIGSYYYNTEDFDSTKYDSTILYSKKSVHYVKPTNKELLINNYKNIGAAYFQYETKEMDDSALVYYELANEELRGISLPNEQYEVWYNLAQWHRYVGDPAKSANYFDKAFDLGKKITGESKNKQFTLAQEQFHTASLEAYSQKVKLRNRNLGLGIAASLLLLLGSFFVIRTTRQQKKLAVADKNIANQKIDNLLQSQEMKNLDAMLEGQDNERKRIAADLHDRLGSMLSTVKLHFTSMEDRLTDLQKENQTQYFKATALLDEATNEVRRISHDLSTGTIAKFGLIPALYELKNTLNSTKRIKINILETGMDERVDMNLEIAIYRIIQELIANTLKHANAKMVNIQLTRMKDILNIIIEDDGIGFDPTKASEGIGLQNIKQRVSKAEGEIIFDSTPQKGTTVILNFTI